MEKDIVRVALATVTAITILNIVTNGTASAAVLKAVFGGWTGVLGALRSSRA